MSFRGLKAILLACGGVGALIAATADANAGGFAIREQSAWGQGSSFAGVAAGGALSSMFWNPATITQMPGVQSEAVLTGILPNSANTPTAGTFFGIPGVLGSGTSNVGQDALVPSGYVSYQFNPSLWVGLSVNAPFGLSVKFPTLWAGSDYASGESHLRTYNATPSIAYRINDWISVGAGVQIQYADASLSRGAAALGGVGELASISGNGWGYGFTAGVTLTPTPATTVGIGYRSAINQKIDGNFWAGPIANVSSSASTTINLPDVVSLGLRQRVSPQWTLLGTVEWTNWSRIGTSTVSGPPPAVPAAALNLPFQYENGWFFSAGAEYMWNDQFTLRAGLGYEKSPITDQVRMPLLPDNDRYWASVGATYKLTNKLSLDAAYSHLFVKNTPIDISATSGNPWFATSGVTYAGTVSSHIDIISVGIKYRFDDPAPPPPKQGFFKAK